MRRLSKFFALTGGITACIFLLVNICDIVFGVIMRQSGAGSIVWTEELARISLVWCVMLGASAAFYEGDNMSIDFAVKALPKTLQTVCKVTALVIECTVLIVLIYYGAQNVAGGWTMRSMALRIPRAVPLMAVPIGMGLFLAAIVSKILSRD